MMMMMMMMIMRLITRSRCTALASAFALATTTAVATATTTPADQPARAVVDLDGPWKFHQGDIPSASAAAFDDSAWGTVAVPHDWSIAGPVSAKNPSGAGGGFFPTGVAWYRKSFNLPAGDASRPQRVFAVFEGVMAHSDVWINGVHLGNRPNGYVSFYYELTQHLRFGEAAAARNTIAVRADTSRQPASRWYQGGGIYRPAQLVITGAVHVEPWSTFVATPSVSAEKATVAIQTTIANQSGSAQNTAVEIALLAPDGSPAGSATPPEQTIQPGATAVFNATIAVAKPALWDTDHPSLYRAIVRVKPSDPAPATSAAPAPASDEAQTTFGIRECHFDAATGFWLNGRNLKLKGVCLHEDGGAFGIAVPDEVWAERLRQLRALGANTIRTSHNPPSPRFLDLADRAGFLIMDEMFDVWTVAKKPHDYHLDFDQWSSTDTRDTVRRDRNHPSVILWSAGNEIHDTPNAPLAKNILARLVKVFHENDPTRPVTMALLKPQNSHDYENGLADMLDVVGTNYYPEIILAAHAAKPTRKILGTENTHDRKSWTAVRDNPPYAGQCLWTGYDYLGESGPWPQIARPFGLLDRTGHPYPKGLERESWWSATPNVHIVRRVTEAEHTAADPGNALLSDRRREPYLRDWTPANTAPHNETIVVYTNCETAELFLNGKSLGRQKRHPDASPLEWTVPYAPGALRAIAANRGQPAATDELRTAGPLARIELTPRQPNPAHGELVAIDALAVDAAGTPVPNITPEVQFSVAAAAANAQIVATDNGSNTEHVPFPSPRRKLHDGRATIWLRLAGPGPVTLRAATAAGIKGETQLTPEGPPPQPANALSF